MVKQVMIYFQAIFIYFCCLGHRIVIMIHIMNEIQNKLIIYLLNFYVFIRMCQDSYFGSFLPSIDIGFGSVADTDIFVLFSAIIGFLNYQLNKDWPENERSIASFFLFVPLQAINDICSYAFTLSDLPVSQSPSQSYRSGLKKRDGYRL